MDAEVNAMKSELGLLNLLCILLAILFVGLAVLNAILSGEFLTTDNLFVTMVCLVMALMFIVNPLLYLKSEGRLPIPSLKKGDETKSVPGSAPALLDSKGRAVPPDVRAMVTRMQQTQRKDG
jgi:hypothetical protein